MIDHAKFIRENEHRQDEPLVKELLDRAKAMLKAVEEHGDHKIWAHKPIGGDR